MVKLPKVRDEHWLEFRYENLLIFYFRCGLIGHPFERCASFLELIDNGIDPDLPYGPQMIGDKLQNFCYNRYRTDFSKANVYPFLTHITKKAIGHVIPALNSNRNLTIGPLRHPSPLTLAESSSNTTTVSGPAIALTFNTLSPIDSLNTHYGSQPYAYNPPITTLTHSINTYPTTEAIYTSSTVIAMEALFGQTRGPTIAFPRCIEAIGLNIKTSQITITSNEDGLLDCFEFCYKRAVGEVPLLLEGDDTVAVVIAKHPSRTATLVGGIDRRIHIKE
ncbi:hypothetical protein F8388_024925 [Cannabis sativa]|uniref:Zinc knuckle CX2CX4HX4C domain-containing protein n=1 Tax=Cannabis sativa TaxID=3483 RepID=A0A7J6GAN7_CANSA|nr:hypothetical protein F8388_024925 [Cannabis sativa]